MTKKRTAEGTEKGKCLSVCSSSTVLQTPSPGQISGSVFFSTNVILFLSPCSIHSVFKNPAITSEDHLRSMSHTFWLNVSGATAMRSFLDTVHLTRY